MRLWSEKLLKDLPNQQLIGQWREVIALLGNGWGKKHSTVDYVFNYPEEYLICFAWKVADEMEKKGYKPKRELIGEALLKRHNGNEIINISNKALKLSKSLKHNLFKIPLYKEHNKKYYEECVENLINKGVYKNE